MFKMISQRLFLEEGKQKGQRREKRVAIYGPPERTYLSFGGGVNSVAMYLMLVEQGETDFEAVFVNHKTDRKETYDYLDEFRKRYPVTVIEPCVVSLKGGERRTFSSLIEYCEHMLMLPRIKPRWCTRMFKREPLSEYFKAPAWNDVGIDAGEAHRAKFLEEKGVFNRWPLIENGINREGCIKLIKRHGLPVPPKSGCFICPFQSQGEWKSLAKKTSGLAPQGVSVGGGIS